jgi:predicted metal-dependent phosphoesterase TrpH
MKYKYQLHTHTAPCSKCGRTTPEELAEAMREGGYQGCVLTNHFYGGNTGISREVSWEECVGAYEKDYLDCKKAAEKYDLDVIFGVEQSIGGGREILCYGITPKMLYDNPDLVKRDIKLWSETLHGYDVLVIQAHPFRKREYITDPGTYPLDYIDGIEVYNRGNLPEANEEAEVFALENPGLIFTSGADTHTIDTVCYAGIETDVRIRDEKDLVALLRSGNYELIKN